MYVEKTIYLYVFMYTCTTYTYTYIFMSSCIRTYINVCICVYVDIFIYLYKYMYMRTSRYICMYTWKDVHKCIHVYMRIRHLYKGDVCARGKICIHAHTSDMYTCAYVTYVYIFPRCRHAYMRIRHLYVTFTQRIADLGLMDLAPDMYVHVYT